MFYDTDAEASFVASTRALIIHPPLLPLRLLSIHSHADHSSNARAARRAPQLNERAPSKVGLCAATKIIVPMYDWGDFNRIFEDPVNCAQSTPGSGPSRTAAAARRSAANLRPEPLWLGRPPTPRCFRFANQIHPPRVVNTTPSLFGDRILLLLVVSRCSCPPFTTVFASQRCS